MVSAEYSRGAMIPTQCTICESDAGDSELYAEVPIQETGWNKDLPRQSERMACSPFGVAGGTMKGSNRPLERNVEVFNADTAAHGGYIYTAVDRWSSRHATGRQTEELVEMLAENFPRSVRVVDIGCGDGTYTIEIAERFGPTAIRGIDPAGNAVDAARARIPSQLSGSVSFEVGSIYDIENKGETVAVVRGVLHHLDRPQAAIAQLTRQFTSLIVLEPNGYNPGMKIIERTSRYHRQHDERSYWPPTLNRWFKQEGFSVLAQKFFCIVPYFCPTLAARILAGVEPAIESLPVVRQIFCGTNLVLYRRLP